MASDKNTSITAILSTSLVAVSDVEDFRYIETALA